MGGGTTPAGPGSSTVSASASPSGAKRKSDANVEDAAQKQQRSKRNRVRFLSYFYVYAYVLSDQGHTRELVELTWSPSYIVHIHSLVCCYLPSTSGMLPVMIRSLM